jgi:hypothetical protein
VFWRNILPPSSWLEGKLSKKPTLSGFLFDLLFSSKDGGNVFLQNVVGLVPNSDHTLCDEKYIESQIVLERGDDKRFSNLMFRTRGNGAVFITHMR